MRKLMIVEHISLDGVISSGGPNADTNYVSRRERLTDARSARDWSQAGYGPGFTR